MIYVVFFLRNIISTLNARLSQKSFNNLKLVRESLKRLMPNILDSRLPIPPSQINWNLKHYDSSGAITSVNRMSKLISNLYSLKFGKVIVAFRANLEVPGRVEIQSGDGICFIELQSRYKASPEHIAAILGHEFAHIFLHHHGLNLTETLSDEILTDVTAAIYGFAEVMGRSVRITERTETIAFGTKTTRTEHKLGYLTTQELGYVLERNNSIITWSDLCEKPVRVALNKGSRRARAEMTSPPLAAASVNRRIAYTLRRILLRNGHGSSRMAGVKYYDFDDGHVRFYCPKCCQKLRLPLSDNLVAKCGNCMSKFPCVT